MSGRRIGTASWRTYAGAPRANPAMRGWLVDTMSLTAKLTASCGAFRVRRLCQRIGRCTADEAESIGLRRVSRVRERDVLLLCDGVPVVYAHTVVPLAATAADWPFFGGLGERSLGTTLFRDPRVSRGPMAFAKLQASHPLVRRAARALGAEGCQPALHARRCLYRRKRGLLLVTEIFLPAILRVGGHAGRHAKPADKGLSG